jgi:flagellar protein FlaF
MSHDLYRRVSAAAEAPRDAEYRAFCEATRRLMAVEDSGRTDLKALIRAVHLNRELWARLATDCADDRNRLAVETRARVIALARSVSRYSTDAVRGKKSLSPLIELNRVIMDGLAGRSPAA